MTNGRPQKGLVENTVLVFGAEILVMAVRVITVFVLARQFGPAVNGVYVGLVSMLQLLAPASQWGMGHVGVRSIARGEPMAAIWPRVLTTTVGGAFIGTAAASLLAIWLLDVSTLTVVLFGMAQLAGMGLAQAATMAAEAHRRSDVSVKINFAGAIVRLGALGVFLTATAGTSIDTWAYFLLAGMGAWAGLAALIVVRSFDGRNTLGFPSRSDLRHGAGFVFVQASATAQSDIDKVVLNGYGLKTDAGVYGPGYRIAELATIPLLALVKASYADFFRRGSTAVHVAMGFARRLTAFGVAYGLFAAVALWLLAPIVPVLLGDDYEDSVQVIRLLSFIPLVKGLQYFPANVLTGSDRHLIRSWLVFATAMVNLVANLLFVPEYGWKAAVATTLLAETLFAVLLWVAVIRLSRAEVAVSKAAVR